MKKIKNFNLDRFLLFSLSAILILHYAKLVSAAADQALLTFFASVATLPVILSAFYSVRQKKISIDLLASIALVASLLNMEWASAVFINLMLTSARIFADYTANRSRSAIKGLLKLKPEKVKIKNGKSIVEESVSKIKKDDLVVIELGERIPIDGMVVSGQAQIDQSSLTGESLSISKGEGDMVYSSTLNVSGSIIVRAEKVGKDTAFEKIIKLVDESQNDKAGIQTVADKFATYYIIITVIGALAIYLYYRDLRLVLAVLLVACADDIAVAIPMAFSAAIGNAAKQGIVIKGGQFLEGLTRVKTIIMDKTGTLTRGRMKVEGVKAFGKYSEQEVIRLAATADIFSEHPIAKAVAEYASAKKIKFEKPKKFKEFSGKGMTAEYQGKEIVAGKISFLRDRKISMTDAEHEYVEKAEKSGISSVLPIGFDGKLAGAVLLADEIRPETKRAIMSLKDLGVDNMVMLTGDNEKVARKVSKAVGIGKFHANLLPEDKLDYVKKYLNKKYKVAMVGDGVNDAASLALADIGIAMGAIGADSAIEAADVALMKDDFSKIPDAIRLSQYVHGIARQDFLIWGVVNLLGLGLVFGHVIGPEGAAAFNFITDFFPIINSLRVFRYEMRAQK